MKKPRARERKPRTWWLVLDGDVDVCAGAAFDDEESAKVEARVCGGAEVVRVVEQAKGRGVKG